MNEIEVLHSLTIYRNTISLISFSLEQNQIKSLDENEKSVFIRFCANNSNEELKDLIPKDVEFHVNNKWLCLESKSLEEDNWHTPLHITEKCKNLTTDQMNVIKINTTGFDYLIKTGYAVEVILAKKLKVDEILDWLETSLFMRPVEETLNIIKSVCTTSDEIQLDFISVPLTCPVTKKVVQIPLVGQKCKHVNCFDGKTFLEMNISSLEWLCPVCFNVIRKDELVFDPFVADILHSTGMKFDKIEFDNFGNFIIREKEVINLDDEKEIESITLSDSPLRDRFPNTIKIKLDKDLIDLDDEIQLSSGGEDDVIFLDY